MFNYTRIDKSKPSSGKCIYPTMPTKPCTPVITPIEQPSIPEPPTMPAPTPSPEPPTMPQPPTMPTSPITPCPSPCPAYINMNAYYNCPSKMSADVGQCHNDMEIAYLKKMYPPVCQKIQRYVDNELNQYDHELSPIYEMYPSSKSIDYIANCIYTRMKGEMPNMIKDFECNQNMRSPIGGSFYTLIYALLLNELYRKRMRKFF